MMGTPSRFVLLLIIVAAVPAVLIGVYSLIPANNPLSVVSPPPPRASAPGYSSPWNRPYDPYASAYEQYANLPGSAREQILRDHNRSGGRVYQCNSPYNCRGVIGAILHHSPSEPRHPREWDTFSQLLQSTIDQYEADEIAKYTIEIGFRRYPDDIVVYIDLSVERQRGLLASTEQSIVETIPQFNETYILEVVYTELGIPLDYLFEDHRTLRNSAPSTLQAQRSDASDLDDSREQDTPATAASDPQPGSLGGPIGTDEITTVTDATPPQAIRRPRTPSNFWGRALAIGMGLVGIFVGAGCGIAAIRNPEKRSDRLWQLSLMITPASTTAIYAIILR